MGKKEDKEIGKVIALQKPNGKLDLKCRGLDIFPNEVFKVCYKYTFS